MSFFTQQKQTLLLTAIIAISLLTAAVVAQTKQTNVKYVNCNHCNGTGKNICQYCGGNKCPRCNYSGVQYVGDGWAALGLPNGYSCPICKGKGKTALDTRFEGCFKTFKNVGLESDKAYLCPETHSIGRVVIVDDYVNGKILKKYTRAEWDQKEADDRAAAEAEKAKPVSVRSRSSIQRIIMQNMAKLRYQYNQRLQEKPGMRGKIMVKFAIDDLGKVIFAEVVESTISDSKLEAIVVSEVKGWQFEKVDKPGDITEITYPFNFE